MALFTDLYELTMAYAYWKREMADDEAVFHLFFRKAPFQGGYTIAAGLESVIDYIKKWRFQKEDIDYLSTLKTADGNALFEDPFLLYLEKLKFTGNLYAVREGEVVFPYEPLIRVEGSILQAQLLESVLLNLINFSSLIATKAARVVYAAGGDPVIEFGMRRAQGVDGALTASRATYIGGCDSTSNTLAGMRYGIPVKGTHAHSWVMAFEHEQEAFRAYAEAMPHNCVFLVDTYDTLEGVQNAIEVGKWLKEQGRPFLGVRLDSGDIAYLSVQARKLLDDAGFYETRIFASNELDEHLIADLKSQGAQVAVWGVGTSLVTGKNQGALDGVFKISAFRKPGEEEWHYRLKFAERMSKTSDPGVLQVSRFLHRDLGYVADAIHDVSVSPEQGCSIIDPLDPIRTKEIEPHLERKELLHPIFEKGECVYSPPSLINVRSYCREQLALFDRSIKRFANPHSYPVGMELSLYERKLDLVNAIKKRQREGSHSC